MGVMNHVGLLGHLKVKAKINIKIQLANLNNLATSFVELMFDRCEPCFMKRQHQHTTKPKHTKMCKKKA
jgi:hypothetical protein